MKKSSWSGPLWLLKMLCAKIDSSTTGINNKLDDVVTFIQNLFSSAASVTGTAADLLNGKTFFSGTSVVTGTMPDNGAVSKTLSAGASYTVPRGYHNGSGTVTANSIASQTQATAAAGDIVSSKTAWVNGSKITGSLADKSGTTVTASAVSSDATYTYLTIPAVGKYNTLSKVKTLNSNLATYESGSLSVPKSFSSLSAYVGKNGKLIIVQGTAYKYTDIVYLYDFVNHKKGYLIYKNVNISTYACECFDISAISYNPSTGILSQDIYDEYNTWYGFVGNFYCIK